MKVAVRTAVVITAFVATMALGFAGIFVYWLRLDNASFDGVPSDIYFGLYWVDVYNAATKDKNFSHSLKEWVDIVCENPGERCDNIWISYNISSTVIALLAFLLALCLVSFIMFLLGSISRVAMIVIHSLMIADVFTILLTYGIGINRNFGNVILDWSAGWWIAVCLMAAVLWSSTVMIIYHSVGDWGKKKTHRRID